MTRRPGICTECRKRFRGRGVHCRNCKAETQRLRDIHTHSNQQACEATRERPGAELRVEFYREIIVRGGRLFEKGGAK